MADYPGAQKREEPGYYIQKADRRTKDTKEINNWDPAGKSSFDIGGSTSDVDKHMQDS